MYKGLDDVWRTRMTLIKWMQIGFVFLFWMDRLYANRWRLETSRGSVIVLAQISPRMDSPKRFIQYVGWFSFCVGLVTITLRHCWIFRRFFMNFFQFFDVVFSVFRQFSNFCRSFLPFPRVLVPSVFTPFFPTFHFFAIFNGFFDQFFANAYSFFYSRNFKVPGFAMLSHFSSWSRITFSG